MSRRARTAIRIGAFAALALLLTGCIKLNMNLGINTDNTVSGTVQFGVQKELLELTGQSAEDLLGTAAPFPSDAPGVTVEPFDDGEFVGQQFTFESVPLAEFNSQGAAGATGVTGAGDALNIRREGDTFVVTGVLDLSSGLSGTTGPLGATAQQFLESADIRISITFPGAVVDSNGTVEGNTVTYTPAFGERIEIRATGSAIENGEAAGVTGGGDDSNLLLILIIAAVAVVVLLAIFLFVRSRRGTGGGGATGFGEAGPAATPEVATPPPGAPSGVPPPAPAPPMPPAAPPPPPPEG
jgi:hypothetical protein